MEATIEKTIRSVEVVREAHRRLAVAEPANASLSRYFSPKLAESLVGAGDSPDLSGQRREIAVLFTDIGGFTALTETLDPAQLKELLNEYLSGKTDIVFEHDGTVAKIIGDALHVLFGTLGDQPDYATRDVACASALDVFAEAFRK